MGNLGNQMFIYAMARAMQLEYNDQLTIDLSGLKRGYYTAKYKLCDFNLPNNINYDVDKIGFWHKLYYKATSAVFHIQQYYYKKTRKDLMTPLLICNKWFRRGCYYNCNRPFYEYPVSRKRYKYVYGYFQSEKYFRKYKDVISKELTVRKPLSARDAELIEKMNSVNSVAVSIRASKAPENPKVKDNLEIGFIDKDYYYRGMKEIANRVDNPVFFIFADDIDAVKSEFEFPFPVTYVYPEDSSTGIRLMNNCKHFVIANSTFSWWGAYLADNPNKIIVMPEKFDRRGPYRQDIFIGNPIKLPVTFLTE
jgi:hypothetical protein